MVRKQLTPTDTGRLVSMATMMEIVRATKKNIADIIFLNSFVQKIHTHQHPKYFKHPDDVEKDAIRFFNTILDKDQNYIFIAYQDKSPVGYLWVTVDEVPENPFKHSRQQIYIHQFVVHEEYRHQSIGTGLFSEVTKIADYKGIKHFEVDTWAFNSGAQKFFKHLGFETFNIKMWLDK